LTSASAESAPANTLRELFPALTRCWHAPAQSEGSAVTVGITLRRDGTMFGQPTITYSKLMGDAEAQKRFVASVLASITNGLGGAIAGRRILIRFESHAPQQPV
jgi:hypothetical protein